MKPNEELDLLQGAIALAQDGRRKEARLLLEKIVETDPHSEMAWLWLVETVEKPALRMSILRECLRHNPNSKFAKDGLALLTSGDPQHTSNLFPELTESGYASTSSSHTPPSGEASSETAPPTRPGISTAALTVGCFLLVILIAVGSAFGGLVIVPLMNGRPPAVSLPAPLSAWIGMRRMTDTPTLTQTLTETATATPSETFTPSATPVSASPTERSTLLVPPTATQTPAPSFTPTAISPPTPTLFSSAGASSSREIRYVAAGGCTVRSVPISGGESKTLTVNPPADCASASLSAKGDRIAYIAQPGQNSIQVLNTDGTGSKRILYLDPFEGLPLTIWGMQWSPGGTRLAYVSPSYGHGDGDKPYVDSGSAGWLYALPSDGSAAPKQINALRIEQRFVGGMRWSPDGYWVLVLDHRDAANGAGYYPYAYRASDSKYFMMANLDFQPDDNARFDWSPDSRYVSHILGHKPKEYDCVAQDAPDNQAYLIAAGLTEMAGLPHEPTRQCIRLAQGRDWSMTFGALWSFPDSKYFLLYDKGSNNLVTMARDGTNARSILAVPQEPLYAGWSPDGQWIYFIEPGVPAESGGILEVAHPDGTNWRVLAYGVTPGPVVWK